MSIVEIQFSSDCAPGLGWWCILHCLHPPGVVTCDVCRDVPSTKYVSRVTCYGMGGQKATRTLHTAAEQGDRGEDGDYYCVTRQRDPDQRLVICLCSWRGSAPPHHPGNPIHGVSSILHWYHHCIAKSPLCSLSLTFLGNIIFYFSSFCFSIFNNDLFARPRPRENAITFVTITTIHSWRGGNL